MIELVGVTHSGETFKYSIPLTERISCLLRDRYYHFETLEIVNIQHCNDDPMLGVLV
jgi:hypothetical protein